MSVTESDQEQAATTTVNSGGVGTAPGFQDARTRARADATPGSVNSPVTVGDAPWSMRAGNAIRSGTKASISHPRTWGIWDQHPASTRAVVRRGADSGPSNHPNAFIRWPARVTWALITAWSAFFCLLAVSPRNKTCWILGAVGLIVLLTWRS